MTRTRTPSASSSSKSSKGGPTHQSEHPSSPDRTTSSTSSTPFHHSIAHTKLPNEQSLPFEYYARGLVQSASSPAPDRNSSRTPGPLPHPSNTPTTTSTLSSSPPPPQASARVRSFSSSKVSKPNNNSKGTIPSSGPSASSSSTPMHSNGGTNTGANAGGSASFHRPPHNRIPHQAQLLQLAATQQLQNQQQQQAQAQSYLQHQQTAGGSISPPPITQQHQQQQQQQQLMLLSYSNTPTTSTSASSSASTMSSFGPALSPVLSTFPPSSVSSSSSLGGPAALASSYSYVSGYGSGTPILQAMQPNANPNANTMMYAYANPAMLSSPSIGTMSYSTYTGAPASTSSGDGSGSANGTHTTPSPVISGLASGGLSVASAYSSQQQLASGAGSSSGFVGGVGGGPNSTVDPSMAGMLLNPDEGMGLGSGGVNPSVLTGTGDTGTAPGGVGFEGNMLFWTSRDPRQTEIWGEEELANPNPNANPNPSSSSSNSNSNSNQQSMNTMLLSSPPPPPPPPPLTTKPKRKVGFRLRTPKGYGGQVRTIVERTSGVSPLSSSSMSMGGRWTDDDGEEDDLVLSFGGGGGGGGRPGSSGSAGSGGLSVGAGGGSLGGGGQGGRTGGRGRGRRVLAEWAWATLTQFGSCRYKEMEFPMVKFIDQGSSGEASRFIIPDDQRCFEWSRDPEQPEVFILYQVPNGQPLARWVGGPFERKDLYPYMQYFWSGDDLLLLFAVMSITLRRWSDLYHH